MIGNPEAVVFDLDGTLVNSRIDFGKMRLIVITRFEEIGVPPGRLTKDLTVSENMSLARNHLMESGMGEILEEVEVEIEEELVRIEREALDGLRAIEGAQRTLAFISRRDISIGVLTRGSREYARDALAKTSLDVFIGEMVCRDDYPWWEAKPNGISLQRVLSGLGASPERSYLVGDHRMDLECAIESGVRFIAVLSGSSGIDDWSSLGDFPVIDSVEGVPCLIDGSETGLTRSEVEYHGK